MRHVSSFTSCELEDDIRRLGLARGDCVVVHSSLSRIGYVQGGAVALIEALAAVVLPGGALLFPNLNIPHAFTALSPPRFDLTRDPIRRALGLVPETFKQQYAEHFSMHPTHSLMGMGDRAAEVVAGHEKAGVPCGRGTPWYRNAAMGGKILLIGVDQSRNTSYHCAEEQLPDSYQLTADTIAGVVIVDGVEHTVHSRLHVWDHHPDFNIVNDDLEQQGFLRRGPVGEAPSLLIDARGFMDICLEKLARDPRYFLTPAAR